jgi:hypothetical protein
MQTTQSATAPSTQMNAGSAPTAASRLDGAPLLSNEDRRALHDEWRAIQETFSDDPKSAVLQADRLVAAAMRNLSDSFAADRSALERQWEGSDEISGEALERAHQRYSAFFHRLTAR